VADWRPDSSAEVQVPEAFDYGGVGRKPS